MAEKNEAIVVADTQNNPAWVANPEVTWIRSYVGSPNVVNGRTIRFINVDSSIPNLYNPEHAQRLKVFADEAAIAIQNARIVEELKERNQDLSTLYEVGLSIQRVWTRGDHPRLMKQNENFKGIDHVICSCSMKSPQKGIFIFMVPMKGSSTQRMTRAPSGVFINEILEQKNTLYLPDHEEKEILQWLAVEEPSLPAEMHTYLGIPLLQGKDLTGIMIVASKKVDAFNQKQIQLFETVASQISITLQNVKMFERMKELAIIDELTGIYNRRFFYKAANKEIERSKRAVKKALSLILIDIDHYKDGNDHYGHMAGDKVLQKITQYIQKELRSADIFARYGGEEFLILLSDTTGQDAVLVAERIRTTIKSLHVRYNEEEITVTISLGVTQMTADATPCKK
jgi:diguanylate cyclase (GGDEF)-like protein